MTLKLQLEQKYKQLYALKLQIQDLETTEENNNDKIRKLALKIMEMKEQKEINTLHKLNRQLGQEINILNKKLKDSITL